MSYQSDYQRVPRVLGSVFFIGMGCLGIVVISDNQKVSSFLGIALFAAFLIIGSCLLMAIASRLYRQHGINRPNFDLTAIMLLTVLVASPFGISNVLWEHFQLDQIQEIRGDKTSVLLMFTGVSAFLLIPVLFLTEALLSWYTLLFRSGKPNSKHKP